MHSGEKRVNYVGSDSRSLNFSSQWDNVE
jgi:hypothetical protein